MNNLEIVVFWTFCYVSLLFLYQTIMIRTVLDKIGKLMIDLMTVASAVLVVNNLEDLLTSTAGSRIITANEIVLFTALIILSIMIVIKISIKAIKAR